MFNFTSGILDKIKKNFPVIKRINKAAELMDSGQFEQAFEILERSKKTSVGTVRSGVCFLHGMALREWSKQIWESSRALNMLEQSDLDFQEAAKLCPSNPEQLRFDIEHQWANTIAEYGKRTKTPEKITFFLQAIEKYMDVENTIANRAALYNDWGNVLWDLAMSGASKEPLKVLDDACDKFQQGIALDGKSASIYSNWGRAIFSQAVQVNDIHLFCRSEDKFQQALNLDPNNQNAIAGMGAVCSELASRCSDAKAGQYFEKGCCCLEKAIQIKPLDYEPYYNLANLYWQYGKKEPDPKLFNDMMRKGLEYTCKSVEINQENAESYLVWGGILLEQSFRLNGDEKRKLLLSAHSKFEDAMNYRSDFTNAHINQGTVFLNLAKVCEEAMKTEMLRKSCEHYRTAIHLEPEIGIPAASNDLMVGLFRISQRVHDKEKHQALDEVISMYETIPSIRIGPWAYNVACAYMLKNDVDNAQKWLLIGEGGNALETRHHAMTDPDMEAVRSEAWFLNIRWKGE